MASKTGMKLVKGRDILANGDKFFSERFSRKIEGNLNPNFNFDIKLDARSADLSFFERGIRVGNERIITALGEALRTAMSSPIWSWESGPRDIVDTGALSGSLTIQKTADGFEVFYSSPYAGIIHYGGYIQPYGNLNIPKKYIPGRPWADSVLFGGGPVEQFNWQSIYEDAILSEFR